jgi:guanylate kinase
MPIIVLIGPSGAGKSTLVDYYIQHHPDARLHKSITTRPKRGDGDTSHRFVSDEEFDKLAADGELIKPVEAFGYRYAITKIPEYDGITFLLLRYQFVEELKRFYPEAKVIQIEAPVEILLKRIASRGDMVRRDAGVIQAEIIAGQEVADYISTSDSSPTKALQSFEKVCKHLIRSTGR